MTSVALVAIQLALDDDAVDGGARFRARLDQALDEAAAAAGSAAHRLLVVPECAGHLAALALAPARARAARTVDAALTRAIATAPWRLVGAAARLGRLLGPRQLALATVAGDAAAWYAEVMSGAARRHRAWLCAGSHLRVQADGAVTNTSVTYAPDGRPVAVTDKVNLVPYLEDGHGLGLRAGRAGDVPVVDAPWGRLATLVCYDGFREPHTRDEAFVPLGPRVDAAGADVLANPAANPWPWRLGWVHAEPGERLLRCEQWRREGLPATLAGLGHARWGVTAHLVGRVRDLRFEGVSEILRRDGDRVTVVAHARAHDRGEVVVYEAQLGHEQGHGAASAAAR